MWRKNGGRSEIEEEVVLAVVVVAAVGEATPVVMGELAAMGDVAVMASKGIPGPRTSMDFKVVRGIREGALGSIERSRGTHKL